MLSRLLNKARSTLDHAMAVHAPSADRALMLQIRDSLEEMKRENQTLLGRLSLPPSTEWEGKPAMLNGRPARSAFPNSTVCRQESFETGYFSYWTQCIGQPLRYHRKLWEFVFILQALYERGAFQPGARGLGFGVGEEPLAAYMASQGCRVLGTDLSPQEAAVKGWTETAQHAHGKGSLRMPWVCPDDLFDANVDFRVADMNAIPADLRGFDFCWSACALEHLGSIEQGLAFIENSVAALRPGGLAVHTTEFNLSSDLGTLDHAGTVLFRKRDLEVLAQRLADKGHRMAPLDLDPGAGIVDRYVDVPPFRSDPHLRLMLGGYAATSVGVIVQRAA